MSHETTRPSWVIEQSLDVRLFTCCGDQDFFPFKCHACGRPLVLCYECETLYTDLYDLSARRFPTHEDYSCPQCGTEFDDDFMRSSPYRIGFDEWHDADLNKLLIDRPFSYLSEMLTASADQMADFLRRGMLGTARTHITEYRNLAEAIAVQFPFAADFRDQGYNVAQTESLSAAMDWHSQIPDSTYQAYALLGVADAVIP